jgi:hypothetical protein
VTRLVTINDCRAAGYCVTGIRDHCALIGVDFRRLVREGIPLEELAGLEDQIVLRCIGKAKEREAKNGRQE